MADRVAALERMLESRPDDARLRFGLALEYLNAGRTEEGVRELRAYLDAADDEGNAWGRLGAVLRRRGRDEEAQRGVSAGDRGGLPPRASHHGRRVRGVLEGWDA